MDAQKAHKAHKQETLLFLVDVDNLFHSARNSYGPSARVDFRKLRALALKQGEYSRVLCKAYTTTPAVDPSVPTPQRPFYAVLQKLGYETCISASVFHGDGPGGGVSRTDIDVSLAVDAVTQKFGNGHPDVVIIASGDSDFLPVYRYLRNVGCYLMVLSFPQSLSTEVSTYVDEVVLLDSDCLFASRYVTN